MGNDCFGALVAGLCLGLAFGLFVIAGFVNDSCVQWRLGPIWYRRAGKVKLLELGGLKLAAIGWRWRRVRPDEAQP